MTDRDERSRNGNDTSLDDSFESLVARGLFERGELLPASEAEVERAERDLEIGPLPEKLAADWAESPRTTPQARSSGTHEISPRRAWPGYAAAAALGALAASLALVWLGRAPSHRGSLISSAPRELQPKPPAPAGAPRLHIAPPAQCGNDCCAGSACPSARDDLRTCSSGRRCVACSHDAPVDGAYRIRVGDLALGAEGKRLRDERAWTQALELCVRVGSAEPACAPSQPQGETIGPWTILPGVVSPQNLLAGFELSVREQGKTQPIASWSTPVAVNADVLCRGIAAKPRSASGSTFAVVSVFLEDTYYVELGRSSTVSALTAARSRFDVTALVPSLYETSASGDRHFALVLGPLDRKRAEEIRWQVLGAGSDAKVSLGSDFVGDPKALP